MRLFVNSHNYLSRRLFINSHIHRTKGLFGLTKLIHSNKKSISHLNFLTEKSVLTYYHQIYGNKWAKLARFLPRRYVLKKICHFRMEIKQVMKCHPKNLSYFSTWTFRRQI